MIEIKKITKKYDDIVILESASYNIGDTGLVCLLGESGSGKTTLARILAGMDNDYTGEIIVNKIPLKKLNDDELCNYRKDYIGFVFQNYNLLKGYTSLENILYPTALNEKTEDENIKYAKELLENFNILEKQNTKIENLSGGQKQRVAIARALINNPNIIIADEPTGALDRKTSKQIMNILKEISKTKLVLVITHDSHICEYADEIISIEDKKIIVTSKDSKLKKRPSEITKFTNLPKINYFHLALKNYQVSFLKYFTIASVFSLGIFAFILSLSSNKVINKEIEKFKDKNTAFNNVYIKNDNNIDQIYNYFQEDERVENVYKQYKIQDVSLIVGGITKTMDEKYPMPKATEYLSYGTMPKINKKEIALTPSLAKKFNNNISELIGKKMTIKYNEETYILTISGIYNAPYDDFFVSSDIERKFYKNTENSKYYSISFDVKDISKIISIDNELKDKDIKATIAVNEVKTIQSTFEKITRLFVIISIIILIICIFIVSILLMKLRNTRIKMIKLLLAMGFNKKAISKIITLENIFLIINSILLTSALLSISYFFI